MMWHVVYKKPTETVWRVDTLHDTKYDANRSAMCLCASAVDAGLPRDVAVVHRDDLHMYLGKDYL